MQLYNFKGVPEATWIAITAALVSATGYFAPLFGLSTDDSLKAAGIVGTLARLVIGALKGDYAFKDMWEVIWAGIQAGTVIVSAIIANWTDANTITLGGIIAIASALPRPVLGAMLDVLKVQVDPKPTPLR